MKPWEGKHWKEYEEEYGKSYTLYNGRESIQAATIALKKDWEEHNSSSYWLMRHFENGTHIYAELDKEGKYTIWENKSIANNLTRDQTSKLVEDLVCAQTAESKKTNGHQESYDLCPTCGTALGSAWEEEPFHDEKKAESFMSSKWIPIETTPEHGQEYLVAVKIKPNFAYFLCTYSNNKFYTFEFTKEVRDVEYYMELPKPPGEE